MKKKKKSFFYIRNLIAWRVVLSVVIVPVGIVAVAFNCVFAIVEGARDIYTIFREAWD